MARLGRMSPADIGLAFVDQDFEIVTSPNGERLKIVGWWIDSPTSSDKAVIIIHGYGDSRAGALAWAPVWLEIGFNVLLIDLRAHGESGGTYTTAGLREGADIEQIAAQIRAEQPDKTRELMLFGVSMGAAVALAAAEKMDDLAGVVLDSPVADFYHGAATQLAIMGLPGEIVLRPGLRLAEAYLAASFSKIRPAELIAKINCPVLALAPAADPFLSPAHLDEISRAIAARCKVDGISQVVVLPEATHLSAIEMYPVEYKDSLNQFATACKSNDSARAALGEAAAAEFSGRIDVDS